MIRWQPGPKKLGCVYHQRGVHPLKGESLVVDVFIMPRIARRRPIAVTIGRYRNYKPVAKREWHLQDPDKHAGVATEVSVLVERVGATPDVAATLGGEVERFLAREAKTLRGILRSLSLPVA